MDKQTELLSDIFYDLYYEVCKELESNGKLPENRKPVHVALDNALYDYIAKINKEEIKQAILNNLK